MSVADEFDDFDAVFGSIDDSEKHKYVEDKNTSAMDKDLTGQIIGKWEVKSFESVYKGQRHYICHCTECGHKEYKSQGSLLALKKSNQGGYCKGCMEKQKNNVDDRVDITKLIGRKYGRWIIKERAKSGYLDFICECEECGHREIRNYWFLVKLEKNKTIGYCPECKRIHREDRQKEKEEELRQSIEDELRKEYEEKIAKEKEKWEKAISVVENTTLNDNSMKDNSVIDDSVIVIDGITYHKAVPREDYVVDIIIYPR